MNKPDIVQIDLKLKVIFLIVSTILSLLIAESALQFVKGNRFFIRQPNRYFVLEPDERYVRGVEGKAQFTVNSSGLRGDELSEQEIKILTIGGSTTECGYLNDSEAWPHLVQEYLSQKTGKKVWVGNAGVSALNSRHHVLQTAELLKQIPKVDLMILLIGANDPSLLKDGYNPAGLESPSIRQECLRSSFEVAPIRINSFKDFQLYRLIRNRFFPKINRRFYRTGEWYEEKRKQRQQFKKTSLSKEQESRLPIGLNEYKENIKKIAHLCQEHETKVLFLTQPTLYKSAMTENEEMLLWGGGTIVSKGSRERAYITASDLRKIFTLYNDQLLETGKKENFEVMDLDAIISPRSDSFYDDQHFNELGSERVAKAVTDFICEQKLLSYECGSG